MNPILSLFIAIILASPDKAIASSTQATGEKILSIFPDKRMLPVLICENNLRQFNKKGEPDISTTSDVGTAQINQVWWKDAKKRGLDIFNSEDDNLTMAKIIYDIQGIKAWNALKSDCYKKLVRDV